MHLSNNTYIEHILYMEINKYKKKYLRLFYPDIPLKRISSSTLMTPCSGIFKCHTDVKFPEILMLLSLAKVIIMVLHIKDWK
jgi:hypothetical protein